MILCCGEALIDMVPCDHADHNVTYAPLSGGAIFNTAIGLGRLEVPVQFLSGISTDLFGEQLVSDLKASGVGTERLIRSKRPTTLAFVKLTDGQAKYTFYDENSAGRMITPNDLPDVGPDISALYFGGISLCAEPAAGAYETLAMQRASAAVMMIDPNIRTSFIEDETAYRARLERMMGMADIVKVSDEDLDWICPSATGLDSQIAALHTMGAGIVILTKGSAGASAYIKGQTAVHVDVPKVSVVDTVGAGDTFNAGVLAQLNALGLLTKTHLASITPTALSQALEFAAKVAAITVSRAGANPPRLADL